VRFVVVVCKCENQKPFIILNSGKECAKEVTKRWGRVNLGYLVDVEEVSERERETSNFCKH